MTFDLGERDPSRVPPGLERREVLMRLGAPVTLSDFTPEERADLLRDLAELRATLRQPR